MIKMGKIAFALSMAVLLFFSFATHVNASDVQLRSAIYLTVLNAPDDYYIGLLYYKPDNKDMDSALKFDKEVDYKIDNYIKYFTYEKWQFFITGGETAKGYQESNPSNYYEFTFVAPNPVRVLIVDKEGNATVSDILYREQVKSKVTYDFKTGKLTEDVTEKKVRTVAYVIVAFLLTLVLEIAFYKVFEIPYTKLNVGLFFVINTVTSLAENLYIITISDGYDAKWPLIILGLLIAVVEALFYTFTLRKEDGTHCWLRGTFYGLSANILSGLLVAILAFLFLYLVY
ncbi:hypothetical protein SAMN02910369_02870 [Lachnospiraceae bacterium NE2001]|nr:hypothetical protein SAMN02910369_02870 [Lachnospiraceae bacterium NE2001]